MYFKYFEKYQVPEEPPKNIVARIERLWAEAQADWAFIESVKYDPTNPPLMEEARERCEGVLRKLKKIDELKAMYLNALKRLKLILWEDPALAGLSKADRLKMAKKMVKPLWFDSSRN